MTALPGYAPRRAHVPYWLIAATLAAAFIAVMPIIAAIVTGTSAGTPTAFASAPAGEYAVVVRSEEAFDVVFAAPAAGGDPVEVTRVPHLPGYGIKGQTSPDGRLVAVLVPDAGSAANPVTSLAVIDLESGASVRLANAVDDALPPVWTRDGARVVFTRSAPSGSLSTVSVRSIPARGGDEREEFAATALGVYPFGVTPAGALASVVIDARGSTLVAGGREVALLSSQITRDWKLSPDGSRVAYIETDLANGLSYHARVFALDGAGSATAQALSAQGQQLGVAWRPGTGEAVFGHEPSTNGGSASAQALTAAGFEVPLSYSAGGTGAVQAWSGSSFAEPGQMQLTLVRDGQRVALGAGMRFLGWSAR
ncbi:MAG: hypothetical protein U0547_08495 [Dehalococcoidia bacterium]